MPVIDPTYFLAALPLIAVLGWFLHRRHRAGVLDQITTERRGCSKVVGRAMLIDGSRHIPVALALNEAMFSYENGFMQGSLERKWIHEVEYESELTTGQAVGDGTVLRLRCFSQAFEFVLDRESSAAWRSALPAYRLSDQNAVRS